MLYRTLSVKTLLRIAGIVLLIYGLFWVARALFEQTSVSGVVQYNGPLLFWDSREIVDYIFFGYPLLGAPTLGGWFYGFMVPGPLLYASIGLVLVTLSTLRPWLVYGSLQVALWLASMSFWAGLAWASHDNGIEIPARFAPYFWVTLLCSLALLVAWYPVVAGVKKLCMPPSTPPARKKPAEREAP